VRISDLYRRGEPVVSFEFFPPKSEAGYESLYRTIADLKQLGPGFVSVTWGAGGSTRRRTAELVVQIQRELGLTAMAHMTCVGAPRAELAETLAHLASEGLENVLALRGDPPKGAANFEAVADGFSHADELVAFVRANTSLCVGGACYPEKHPEAPSAEADLANLVRKAQIERTTERLGWRPRVPLAEGIRRTVEFYRALAAQAGHFQLTPVDLTCEQLTG